MVWIVVCDSLADFLRGNMEGVSNSGSGGHIRYDRFAREEGGYGEVGIADGELGLGTQFVEFASNNLDVGETIRAISECSLTAGKFGEILIVAVITIQDDIGWIHIEEGGFCGGVFSGTRVIEPRWDKVSKSGNVNW